VDYCKVLLEKEEVNIQNSIRNISNDEKESFMANVTTNSGEIILNLNLENDEKALVKIYNVFGGLEFEVNYNISKGTQTIVINASNFKKGIYVVQINVESKTISQTISI